MCCQCNERIVLNYQKLPYLSTLLKVTALLLPNILIRSSGITSPRCVEPENSVWITHVCTYRKGSPVEAKRQLFPYRYTHREHNRAHHKHARPISHGNMTAPTWKAALVGGISEPCDKRSWDRTSVLRCLRTVSLPGPWLLSHVAFLLYNCTVLILSMSKI